MITKFKYTKWGLAFDFENRLCFLSHNDSYKNYSLNQEYKIKIFYKTMYWAYYYQLDKNTKQITKSYYWNIIENKTKEETLNSNEYKLFQIRGEYQIVSYCKIIH